MPAPELEPGKRLTLSKNPEPLTIAQVKLIPRESLLALFDLDGTLTEPGYQILMESFVREVEMGSAVVREKLINCFDKWSEGQMRYENYLVEIGELWARMLSETTPKIKRSEVMQVTDKWYEDVGQKEVMEYAGHMMMDLKRYEFNPVMITGAPYEIAAPFARHMGIQYLFAMAAELDTEERYTGKMRRRNNTGILNNKATICREFGKRHLVGLAAGDTNSDFVLMEAAINTHHSKDVKGRAFLMNPKSDVLESMEGRAFHHFATGRIKAMKQGYSTEFIMEEFRDNLRRIMRDNGMGAKLRRIEGMQKTT